MNENISFILSILSFLNPKILSGPPLRSLFKKVSSRLPCKRKFGQEFPLYLTFSEWMKTRGLFKSLLLWNQSADLKQTWHGWALSSILSNLCPVTTTSIQDGI
jgi:hypothetical protein